MHACCLLLTRSRESSGQLGDMRNGIEGLEGALCAIESHLAIDSGLRPHAAPVGVRRIPIAGACVARR